MHSWAVLIPVPSLIFCHMVKDESFRNERQKPKQLKLKNLMKRIWILVSIPSGFAREIGSQYIVCGVTLVNNSQYPTNLSPLLERETCYLTKAIRN
ncbi:hypothetical protein FKM82_001593 [Ascaphus truei]